jgi:LPXTG-motif cell wall-anchored protein
MKQMKWTVLLAVVFALLMAPAAVAQGTTDDPAQVEAGMAVFESNCASCHTSEGVGSAAGRPLTDIALEEPDRSAHIESVTNGRGGMPAFGAALSEEEIDSVVSYVRLTFVSAQAEEPAEEEPAAEEELASTGVESGMLVVAAVGLGAAGLMLMSTRRRPDTV